LVSRHAGSAYRVLSELEGEGPLAFAARVEDFIGRAFPRSAELELAVVACNQRADETAEVARRALAESVLGRVAKSGAFHFSASDAVSDRFRRRLLDLTAEFARAGGADGRVQASFAEEVSRTTSSPASADKATAISRAVARVA
jgi:hypothetical protein